MTVRHSWVTQGRESAGFIDAAEFEKLEQTSDVAVEAWIDEQLTNTSVTAVLVGAKTCSSKWVKYEIEKSIELGHGLLAIDISKIKDFDGNTSERCGRVVSSDYPLYLWNSDDGHGNVGTWIENAAKAAGR